MLSELRWRCVQRFVAPSQRATRASRTTYMGQMGCAFGQVNEFAYASFCDAATASSHPL